MSLGTVYRLASRGPSGALVVLADRWDDDGGWAEDMAESWVADVALDGGAVRMLHGQVGWLTGIWRSPAGRVFASQAGGVRRGLLVGEPGDDGRLAWQFHELPEQALGVGGAGDETVLVWTRDELYRWRGGGLIRVKSPPGVLAAHGTDERCCYLSGAGFVARLEGDEAVIVGRPVGDDRLLSIFVAAPDAVWACGDRKLVRGDGRSWTVVASDAGAARSVVHWRGQPWLAAGDQGLARLGRTGLELVDVRFEPLQLLAADTLVAVCEDRVAETADGETWREVSVSALKKALRNRKPMWRKPLGER